MTTEQKSEHTNLTAYASRFVADMDYAYEAFHDGFSVGLHGEASAHYLAGLKHGTILNLKAPSPSRWMSDVYRTEIAGGWLAGGYWDRDGLDQDGDSRIAMREISAALLRFYEAGLTHGKETRTRGDALYSKLRSCARPTKL